MRRTPIAALAVLTTTLATTGTGFANAATPVPTVFVVSGTITDSSGTPFPAGTTVRLYAAPTESERSALAEGDSAAAHYLASTTTSSSGFYYLTLQGTKTISPYVNDTGLVNLEVLSQNAAGEIAEYQFTRAVSATSQSITNGSDADGTADASDTDSEDGTVAPTSDITAMAPASSSPAAVASGTQAAVTPATADCTEKLIKKYSARQTVVGATYVTTGDGGQAFNYVQGSSTHVGVGVSLSSTTGYSISGSEDIDGSDSNTTKFGQEKGVKAYRYTQNFDYGKFSYNCSTFPGGAQQLISYRIEAIAYSGPNVRKTTTPPTATHCSSKLDVNTSFEQNTTTATTYGAGVDFGVTTANGSGSLNVTARSGYSKGVTAIFYNNSSSKVHSLCGTAGNAGASKPGRIVLK